MLRDLADLNPQQIAQLSQYLAQFITDSRKELIEKVLSARTRHLTVVLEDIFQSHNASAVVRTCECMGIQDLHIIESYNPYEVNRKVIMGAYKWMNLIRYRSKGSNTTEACYRHLKSKGYTILATDPSPDGISLDDVQTDAPIALVMGNELKGTSQYAIEHADMKVRIPMFGFTESMNISVSAAICINTLVHKVRSQQGWQLSQEEQTLLRLEWYRKCVKRPDVLEKDFWIRAAKA